MRNGLFITGTDTGVGKTVITAQLGLALQKNGYDVGVMKPLQTGLETDSGDYKVYKKWMKVDEEEIVVPIQLKAAQAPSIAFSLEKRVFQFDAIQRSLYILSARHKNMLIEGAGGVLVPISGKFTMRDLMVKIGLPVVIVTRPTLGTINHTLLTIEVLLKSKLEIAGLIFNPVLDVEDTIFQKVKKEIVSLSGVKRYGYMGRIKDGLQLGSFIKFFRK